MSRCPWGPRSMQELLVSSDGKVGILKNVKFMTLFTNSFFLFLPLKEKRIVRKKIISVMIWGFVLQSLPTSLELGSHCWNISYYFQNHTVDAGKTFSSSSATDTCQLLDGISGLHEPRTQFLWAPTHSLWSYVRPASLSF